MKSSERIEKLLNRYEQIKYAYVKENPKTHSVIETLAKKIIVPMLKLDVDVGVSMWVEVLEYYHNKTFPVDYSDLTGGVVEDTAIHTLIRVFSENKTIVDYVFKQDPYSNHIKIDLFICDLLFEKEYDLANELMLAYMQNCNGENDPQENLYSVLQQLICSSKSRWKITMEGISFAKKWMLRVQDSVRKAELDVALLDLEDCYEGNSPKGPMPFSLFASEEGVDMLADEKQRVQTGEYAQKQATAITRKTPEKNCSCDPQKIAEAVSELNDMIGLDEVKEEVNSLINLMQVRKLRSDHGLKMPDMSLHLVFSGNPGTGKSTVARILGKVYQALGILSSGHLIEVDRSGLVAGYVGQTAIKTQNVIQSALGGILFIDEAYSLASEGSENDFGPEAIETLLKAMEDHRDDFVVIVAGYDELIPGFINSNPGLKSRFNKYIYFKDYDSVCLLEILMTFIRKNDYKVTDDATKMLAKYLEYIYQNRDKNFGNARDVRNLFEKIVEKQANRIVAINNPTIDDIQTITKADFPEFLYFAVENII